MLITAQQWFNAITDNQELLDYLDDEAEDEVGEEVDIIHSLIARYNNGERSLELYNSLIAAQGMF